ncbi:uroporphyrinogen-III synthase [Tateyamaria sp. SN6-1]|uniref:uroporphyrinogen-III synthase n=1 Tax=Tateyamaria sp. SN6-1 TaxID=3092148 RepID=UPI0039F47534
MTRPLAAAQRFVADLPDTISTLLHPIYSPLLRIVPTDQPAHVADDEAVIFTSANGVRFAPEGGGRRAFCVGAATAAAAQARGWHAVQAGETADTLVDTMRADMPPEPLVHLSGVHTRGDIVRRLRAAGARIRHIPVYDQVRCDLTEEAHRALAGEAPTLIPLFSPRTADQFFANDPVLRHAVVLALSPAVADAAPEPLRPSVIITVSPDAAAMSTALGDAALALASG